MKIEPPLVSLAPIVPPKTEVVERRVKISTLTELERQKLWSGIKRTRPALAKMITDDPFLTQLKKEFGAELGFKESEVMQLIASAKPGSGQHEKT